MKSWELFDQTLTEAVEAFTKNAEEYYETLKKEKVTKEVEPGDVVRLKCGGKSMVVNEIKGEILICYVSDNITNLPKAITVPKRVVEILA